MTGDQVSTRWNASFCDERERAITKQEKEEIDEKETNQTTQWRASIRPTIVGRCLLFLPYRTKNANTRIRILSIPINYGEQTIY